MTQCPIVSGDSFRYEFEAGNQAGTCAIQPGDTHSDRSLGTFWYHSHLAVQYCDGLRGVMVIKDPNDPYKHLYDVDNGTFYLGPSLDEPHRCSEQTVITLADWYHTAGPDIKPPACVSPPLAHPLYLNSYDVSGYRNPLSSMVLVEQSTALLNWRS